MRRRLIRAALYAVAASLVLVMPVLAHGDQDARPLARDLKAGPYVISLWQVTLDAGPLIGPHLIVMFDGGPAVSTVAEVGVAVNAQPLTVVARATGTDGGMAPGPVNYEELDQPAVIRRNRGQTVEAMHKSGVEMLDIPAFLRKQAD